MLNRRHPVRSALAFPAVLALALVLAGCQGIVEPRTDEPTVEGTVAEKVQDGRLRLDHLTEAEIQSSYGGLVDDLGPEERNELSVYVTVPPTVFRERPSGLAEVSPDDLKIGDRIQAWAVGETRSLPPTFFTDQILILQD